MACLSEPNFAGHPKTQAKLKNGLPNKQINLTGKFWNFCLPNVPRPHVKQPYLNDKKKTLNYLRVGSLIFGVPTKLRDSRHFYNIDFLYYVNCTTSP